MLFIRKRSAHRIEFIWTAKNWYLPLDPIHFFTTSAANFFCSVWLTCGIRGAIWLEFLVIASYGINIDNNGGQRGIESRPDQTSRLFQKRLRLTAGPVSQSLFVCGTHNIRNTICPVCTRRVTTSVCVRDTMELWSALFSPADVASWSEAAQRDGTFRPKGREKIPENEDAISYKPKEVLLNAGKIVALTSPGEIALL